MRRRAPLAPAHRHASLRSRDSAPRARCIASTTAFPSVTGSPTLPFSPAAFPARPDFRAFDGSTARTRAVVASRTPAATSAPRCVTSTSDLDPSHPTLFELAPSRFNAMSMLGRGTGRASASAATCARWLARRTRTGAATSMAGSRSTSTSRACRRATSSRGAPAFACIAMLGLDKASHSAGHDRARSRTRARDLDTAVGASFARCARARGTMGRDRTLDRERPRSLTRARTRRSRGARARERASRPRASVAAVTRRADVAVMVSGNAMAHLYVELERRERAGWNALRRAVGSARARAARRATRWTS